MTVDYTDHLSRNDEKNEWVRILANFTSTATTRLPTVDEVQEVAYAAYFMRRSLEGRDGQATASKIYNGYNKLAQLEQKIAEENHFVGIPEEEKRRRCHALKETVVEAIFALSEDRI